MKSGDVYQTRDGEAVVVNYHSCMKVEIMFTATGGTLTTQAAQVRSGRVKDRMKPSVEGVGFIGIGKYASRVDGKFYNPYLIWKGMIRRCYSSLERYKHYEDVTVCDSWHNFQNFAEWYVKNHPNDGNKYDIDKDILSTGVKIYSPETCSFVTKQENNEAAKSIRAKFVSPEGEVFEVFNVSKFARENGLDRSHLLSVASGKAKSHKGWKKYVSVKEKAEASF